MSQGADDSPSITRFMVGVVFGVFMTFAYTRYAWKMPEVVQLPAKITEAAISTTAAMDLFSPTAADEVRHRAFSVLMSQQADDFAEIDKELGSPLMQEVLRREAFRESKLLKHQMSAYQAALEQPALRQALERKHGRTDDDEELKRRMLLSAVREEEFTNWYLETHFPNLTPNETVDLILNVYQNELRSQQHVAVEAGEAARL
jgi:hypothetical protein